MEEYLTLGTIIDAFSLDGTCKILSHTDFANFRYQKGNKLFISLKDKTKKEVTVDSYRSNKGCDFVNFLEINTNEEALSFKGCEILVIKNRDDLKEGYYFYSDLQGCNILDENGNVLGKVKQVEEYPAQLTLRVKRENKPDFLVPFVKAFIRKVDIDNKEIVINILEGLL